jgi:hypothetical protein
MEIPILIVIFKRPDTTRTLINALREIKPTKIYIAADAPRFDRPEEEKLNKETLKCLELIDWKCEIKTNFSNKNMGVDPRMESAITWLFSQEETGIILEDDCIPNSTFFLFCRENLQKYKNNKRIMAINGTCFIKCNDSRSYYFSQYFSSWGWATWKRSWDLFCHEVDYNTKYKVLNSMCNKFTDKELTYWNKYFENYINGKYSFWDGKWMFTIWKNDGLCIAPTKNLILNIGFSLDSTHTFNREEYIPTYTEPMDRIIHPEKIKTDRARDYELFTKAYYRNIFKRILYKLRSIIIKISPRKRK